MVTDSEQARTELFTINYVRYPTLGGSSPSNFVLAENDLGCHQVVYLMVQERFVHLLCNVKLVTHLKHPLFCRI
ncbi:hypothetical protein EDC53_101570 [Phytobacter diazotrophicus]|nr:hypothetical protein EDC53_101570 [Phytobacter diazotrophicus]